MKLNYEQAKDLLSDKDWKVDVVKLDKNNPVEVLKLHFNFPITDEKGEFIIVLDTPEIVSLKSQESSHFGALEFFFTFEKKVKREAILDTYLFLNRLNKNMFVPGFGINEGSHTVFFRYTLFVDEKVTKEFVHNIVKTLINVVDTCNDTVNQVASGQISIRDLLEKGEDEFIDQLLSTFHQVIGR